MIQLRNESTSVYALILLIVILQIMVYTLYTLTSRSIEWHNGPQELSVQFTLVYSTKKNTHKKYKQSIKHSHQSFIHIQQRATISVISLLQICVSMHWLPVNFTLRYSCQSQTEQKATISVISLFYRCVSMHWFPVNITFRYSCQSQMDPGLHLYKP